MASTVHFFDTFHEVLQFEVRAPEVNGLVFSEVIEKSIADPVQFKLVYVFRGFLKGLISAACGRKVTQDEKDRIRLAKMGVDEGDGVVGVGEGGWNWWKELRGICKDEERSKGFDEFWGCAESVRKWWGDRRELGEEAQMDWDGWIRHVNWGERLGLIYNLCALVAGENEDLQGDIRKRVKLSEPLHRKEYGMRSMVRLKTIGKCSRKRWYWVVGGSRIYSGYKTTGSGGIAVECANEKEMKELVKKLLTRDPSDDRKGGIMRDRNLGGKIQDFWLRPLEEEGEKRRKILMRNMQAAAAKEEARIRNATRPRRRKAAYHKHR